MVLECIQAMIDVAIVSMAIDTKVNTQVMLVANTTGEAVSIIARLVLNLDINCRAMAKGHTTSHSSLLAQFQ